MLHYYKIIFGIALLLFTHIHTTQAQHSKLNWGVSSQIKVREISQNHGEDDIFSMNKQVFNVGVFMQYGNFEANMEFFTKTVNLDMRYFIWDKVFTTLKGSWDVQNFEADHPDLNYYIYNTGEIDVYSYMGGFGYANTFHSRLYCRGSLLGGVIHSTKGSVSNMLRRDYDSNIRAQKTDTYQIKSSFILGAAFQFEWLPNPSKNKLHPLVPFVHLGISGKLKSRTYRHISIEEWVASNVVYSETNNPNDKHYNLLNVDFKVGIKMYLRK
ncbi:hypothetical protein [Marinifilum sp. D737]|uniref:hypothetical protein n=1 Tax=Marinifilum sp. D737 TaxID=2969628 RepID=UPI002275E627|nr:hypothetical protein [Marinifilum sp. D737]MCY1636725.1 hypothetical protein [Marinifilum sp. D737]